MPDRPLDPSLDLLAWIVAAGVTAYLLKPYAPKRFTDKLRMDS